MLQPEQDPDCQRLMVAMKTVGTMPLAKGQIWKTRAADIEIVELGKRFIHYRITNQDRKVSAQVSGIEAMRNYLAANAARLASPAANN